MEKDLIPDSLPSPKRQSAKPERQCTITRGTRIHSTLLFKVCGIAMVLPADDNENGNTAYLESEPAKTGHWSSNINI